MQQPDRSIDLPAGAIRTGTSPEFDAHSLPSALQREHRIATGRFGLLRVLAGSLQFVVHAEDGEQSELLSEGQTRWIRADEPHRVVPGGGMRFRIEFYREAGASD